MKFFKKKFGSLVSFAFLAAFIFVNTKQAQTPEKEAVTNNKTQATPQIKTGIWGTETLGQEVIYFFDKHDESYFLTNFALCPITIDGITYKTSEYYFQAMKFPDYPELQEKIKAMDKASDTKKFALEHRDKMRKDWFSVSMDIMKKAVLAKFEQNKDAQKLLLSTGDKILVENNPNDSFWAAGADGNGTNHTGLIIMEVRTKLLTNIKLTEESKETKK